MEKPIDDIVLAKLSGELLSEEEEKLFQTWYSIGDNRQRFYRLQCLRAGIRVNRSGNAVDTGAAWKSLNQRIRPRSVLARISRYAAAVVLLTGLGITAYLLNMQKTAEPVLVQNETVLPGKKQAILTLATGEKIQLSDTLSRIISQEKGVTINNDSHTLAYNLSGETDHPVYHTITIPRGGEYVLVLADETKIWLNSESRITYPVAFAGITREITLEGEAYFEIAKDTTKPFIVHTGAFDIRVTGTQFNVRTYPEEPYSTTLTEGSIQLERAGEVSRLVPGQQAFLRDDHIEIREVDTEEAIAWRYETFSFKQRNLGSILNELSRWYDINIFYQNPEVKAYHFTAWFKRSSSIEEVIQILEKTNKIKMELKGKTLTVKTNSEK